MSVPIGDKMPLPTEDKARKAIPIFTFLTEYFPDAVLAMVGVSVAGNIQHNPELDPADIRWAREKSRDQLNTAMRHLWDRGTGTERDADGQWHLAKAAWRILAQLQLDIEKERELDALEEGPYDEYDYVPDMDYVGEYMGEQDCDVEDCTLHRYIPGHDGPV